MFKTTYRFPVLLGMMTARSIRSFPIAIFCFCTDKVVIFVVLLYIILQVATKINLLIDWLVLFLSLPNLHVTLGKFWAKVTKIWAKSKSSIPQKHYISYGCACWPSYRRPIAER